MCRARRASQTPAAANARRAATLAGVEIAGNRPQRGPDLEGDDRGDEGEEQRTRKHVAGSCGFAKRRKDISDQREKSHQCQRQRRQCQEVGAKPEHGQQPFRKLRRDQEAGGCGSGPQRRQDLASRGPWPLSHQRLRSRGEARERRGAEREAHVRGELALPGQGMHRARDPRRPRTRRTRSRSRPARGRARRGDAAGAGRSPMRRPCRPRWLPSGARHARLQPRGRRRTAPRSRAPCS